jgi:hypothetical protein
VDLDEMGGLRGCGEDDKTSSRQCCGDMCCGDMGKLGKDPSMSPRSVAGDFSTDQMKSYR